MEKDAVIKIRETFRKAKFTLTSRKTGEKKEFSPQLHVILDNSCNLIDDGEGSLIWDDDNELLWWFKANSPGSYINSPSSGMNFGSSVEFAGLCNGSNFEQIQDMRILFNEEAYYNLCNAINEDKEIMTKEQIENNYIKIFEETDMYSVITRKKEINYNTGLPKKYDPRYTEDSAYVITNHSNQSGGV